MRTYYLFLIQEEYHRIYHKNPFVLYKILETIYQLKIYDFSYGITLYKQLCIPFSTKLLTHYIESTYPYQKRNRKVIQIDSRVETTFLEINPSCIVIKTDTNFPAIFRTFHIYNKHVFVCDFVNQDYFWLSEQVKIQSTFV